MRERNASRSLAAAKTARRVVIAVLLLSGLVFAGACDVATQLDFRTGSSGPTSFGSNWKTLSFLALTISGFLIGLVFMFGRTFDNPALLNRAKTDLNQFIATALILALFYGFVNGICNIDAGQFGLPNPSLFEAGRAYFRFAEKVSMAAFQNSMDALMYTSAVGSLYIANAAGPPLGPLLPLTFSIAPFSGYSAVNGALAFLTNIVSLSVAITSGYGVILTAVENWFLNLLLPAGVIMRCFTPTRELGGVLISIAMGLFIFYPLLFSLSYLMLGAPSPNIQISGTGILTIAALLATYVLQYTIASLFPLATVGVIAYQYFNISNIAAAKVLAALGSVGNTILPVFILPAINWVILVVMVRAISKVLGEEIDISGLTRLI